MKDKNLGISLLNQLYGAMLTDRQEEMLKAYYDFDCSLAEIADEHGISRQAVRDSIKRAEAGLQSYEEKFGFASMLAEARGKLAELRRLLASKAASDETIDGKIAEVERILEG